MKTKSIIKALDKSEDFVWSKNNLLMAKGSKLFKFSPGKDKNWVEITDFKNTGIKDILRLAVSPKGDKLAFVSNIP